MNVIARPFGMLMMFLYELVNNYGVAVILLALVIAIVLLPLQMKAKRGAIRGQRLQPKIQEIQKRHAANKQKMQEEISKMYKEEGASPASGCGWNLLPMPILFALFFVISQPITMMMGVPAEKLAPPAGVIFQELVATNFESELMQRQEQIAMVQHINRYYEQFEGLDENLRRIDYSFLGADLGAQPWNFLRTMDWGDRSLWGQAFILLMIPLLSGGSQYLQTFLNKKLGLMPMPMEGAAGAAGGMKGMMMLMPLISVFFSFTFPAALGLYWTAGNLIRTGQDVWLTKKYTKIIDAEDAVRNEERKRKEEELEKKRLETERKKAEGLVERNPNTSKRKVHMNERQSDIEKAAEWNKKDEPAREKDEPGRVGERRNARGRAYVPDRYEDGRIEESDEAADDERDEIIDAADEADETNEEPRGDE